MRATLALTLALTGACATDKAQGDTAPPARGDDGDPAPIQAACGSGESGSADPIPAHTLSAAVTWTLGFDAEAEANGFSDCAYSRTYEGVQVLGLEYLCPECAFIVRGTATMTEGIDCYTQIATEPTDTRVEMWGVSEDGRLFRAGLDQFALGELTTFTRPSAEGDPVAVSWSSEGELTEGGNLTLAAEGEMAWVVDEDLLLDDPWGPRPAPYTCGWECNDPGDLTSDYSLSPGAVLPNARLEDACGEPVDLWDFYGSYLVIDSSQSDCGPCRSMAEAAPAFQGRMRAAGVPVRVITLMGNGLAEPHLSPDLAVVQDWIDRYALTDPVLVDRGYAYATLPTIIAASTGESFGFPAWAVIGPDMEILYGDVGFTSRETAAAYEGVEGTWDTIEAMILEDAGLR